MPPNSKNGNLNIVTSDSPQSELYELYEPQYFLYPSVLSSHANSPANSPSPLLEQSSASSVSSSSISSRSSFSISSRDSLSPHTVKSCKHCSFSFYRTDQTEEYCSKDCRVCNTWFKPSHLPQSISAKETNSPSPTEKICLTNTDKKIKQHYYDIKNYSDASNCYNETWRNVNTKGSKTNLQKK